MSAYDERLGNLPTKLALGRLFRIMSRPYQPGDDDTYMICRSIILNTSDGAISNYRPNYARDHNKGASGQ